MDKKVIIFFLIIIFLISLGSLKLENIKRVEEFRVVLINSGLNKAEIVGNSLNFYGIAEIETTLKNNENREIRVIIKVDKSIKDFINISEKDFIINKQEEKKIEISNIAFSEQKIEGKIYIEYF